MVGVCGNGSGVTCPAPDQCHLPAVCNPTLGCVLPAQPNGTACNDNNACTRSDTCEAGTCVGQDPVVCAPPDQCQVAAGICNKHTGICSPPAKKPNGTPCNDLNACTTSDVCQSGNCTGKSPVKCTAADQCHTAGVCDAATGVCSNPPKSDGVKCNDGSVCTKNEVCVAGVCGAGSAISCAVPDQCHLAAACDRILGCLLSAQPNGTSCNDNNPCTRLDTCQAGTCVGQSPVVCAPADQCHTVVGTCNKNTGVCTIPGKKPNGTPCNDGNSCTRTDACQAGICSGTSPVVCTAADQCHTAGNCNPASGTCSSSDALDGTACDDGNTATTGDACHTGACTGTPSGESCLAIQIAQPGLGDGTYVLDPDGAGPIQPLQVFCDMTTDGGGWTLVLKTDASSTAHYTSTAVNVGALASPSLNTVAKLDDAAIQALQGTNGETRVESPNISWKVFSRGNSWGVPRYAGYPREPQAKADAMARYQAGGQCYDGDWPCASDHYCFGVFPTSETSAAPFLEHACIRRFATPGIFFNANANPSAPSYEPGRVWVRSTPPAVTATIPVGTSPSALAINSATNRIYVGNYGTGWEAGTVTVIDGATNATSTVTTGRGPISAAINKVTNQIYVTNYGTSPSPDYSVTQIDGATNAVTMIPVGPNPYFIDVNETTNNIYLTQYGFGGSTVSVIDGVTLAVTTVNVAGQPENIKVNATTNKIYMGHVNGSITILDGATNATTNIAGGSRISGIAVNPVTNKIYFGRYSSGIVTVMDGATNAITDITTGGSPGQLRVNTTTNKIYVANASGDNGTVIDGTTNVATVMPLGAPSNDLALLPSLNRVFVTNPSSTVRIFDVVPGTFRTISVGASPQTLGVDPSTSRVYVINSGDNTVSVIE